MSRQLPPIGSLCPHPPHEVMPVSHTNTHISSATRNLLPPPPPPQPAATPPSASDASAAPPASNRTREQAKVPPPPSPLPPLAAPPCSCHSPPQLLMPCRQIRTPRKVQEASDAPAAAAAAAAAAGENPVKEKQARSSPLPQINRRFRSDTSPGETARPHLLRLCRPNGALCPQGRPAHAHAAGARRRRRRC
jgi:hypothetical protein